MKTKLRSILALTLLVVLAGCSGLADTDTQEETTDSGPLTGTTTPQPTTIADTTTDAAATTASTRTKTATATSMARGTSTPTSPATPTETTRTPTETRTETATQTPTTAPTPTETAKGTPTDDASLYPDRVRVVAAGSGESHYEIHTSGVIGYEFGEEADTDPVSTRYPETIHEGACGDTHVDGFVGDGGADTYYSEDGQFGGFRNLGNATIEVYVNGELVETLEPNESSVVAEMTPHTPPITAVDTC